MQNVCCLVKRQILTFNKNTMNPPQQQHDQPIIPDPLDHQLAAQHRATLRVALDHNNNPINCPWFPSVNMYEWIVIVMAMFEVYHNYVEGLVAEMLNRLGTFDQKNFIMQLQDEIKNLAVVCFARAVQGYPNGTHLFRAGSTVSVLTNSEFYRQCGFTSDTWTHAIIEPVAVWMTESFGQINGNRTIQTVWSNGHPRQLPWFTEDHLQNTAIGGTSLYHFDLRTRYIATNILALDLTVIHNHEWLTFLSGVILVRLGILTDRWRQPENLTVREQETWNHLRQFAWDSETAVAHCVEHHAQVHGF